jgi:5-methylcytosine-specific restriction protein B
LEGLPGRIQSILERKRQVILYGPPGTGKTYWAIRSAIEIASLARFEKFYRDLPEDEKNLVFGDKGGRNGMVRLCTFHPVYGYEDFIEGYRPISINGQLSFEKQPGIFKQLCTDAQKDPSHPYILIIDEINRGDIPRIFGELITLLEKDKRGQFVLLPVSKEPFQVPTNVYLIGTMNTADRSIALLDTALRRRFGFIELMPDTRLLDYEIEGLPLGPWLEALNQRIRQYIGHDARNLQIGHAFFLEGEKPISDKARFVRVFQEDIFPLLGEYCYEDYETLEKILGDRLIDLENQRIREELLSPERWDQLLQALLAPTPDLTTSNKVLMTQQSQPAEDVDNNESEENAES